MGRWRHKILSQREKLQSANKLRSQEYLTKALTEETTWCQGRFFRFNSRKNNKQSGIPNSLTSLLFSFRKSYKSLKYKWCLLTVRGLLILLSWQINSLNCMPKSPLNSNMGLRGVGFPMIIPVCRTSFIIFICLTMFFSKSDSWAYAIPLWRVFKKSSPTRAE